jgi:hypothetical protein
METRSFSALPRASVLARDGNLEMRDKRLFRVSEKHLLANPFKPMLLHSLILPTRSCMRNFISIDPPVFFVWLETKSMLLHIRRQFIAGTAFDSLTSARDSVHVSHWPHDRHTCHRQCSSTASRLLEQRTVIIPGQFHAPDFDDVKIRTTHNATHSTYVRIIRYRRQFKLCNVQNLWSEQTARTRTIVRLASSSASSIFQIYRNLYVISVYLIINQQNVPGNSISILHVATGNKYLLARLIVYKIVTLSW